MSMDKSKLAGKTALIKFIEKDTQPIPVTIESFDDSGIWTREASLIGEFIEEHPVLQQVDIGKPRLLFLPLSQLEWLMVLDGDSD